MLKGTLLIGLKPLICTHPFKGHLIIEGLQLKLETDRRGCINEHLFRYEIVASVPVRG